jgi:transposase
MSKHLHKRVDDVFLKFILEKYTSKQLSIKQACQQLNIGKSQLFRLLKRYSQDPNNFSIQYYRNSPKRISPELEKIIIKELKNDKKLIDDPTVPINKFNYSYIKQQIFNKHNLDVSTPTIIKRAKEINCYMAPRKRVKHDREVLTNYPGELIQHDSSLHLFAPSSQEKWYLITSIDDYTRYMLYAQLQRRETSWTHISALENVIYSFGIPLSYYVDSHSIFRFVQGRDSNWRHHKKLTDQVTTQFKHFLNDLDIKITYALSPQAKGKVERPYQWLQDHLVRTCARENIKSIDKAQEVLKHEIHQYNNKWVHSTTKEIPVIRLNKALKSNSSFFREFSIPSPYESSKDIFCLREERIVDAYHKISFNKLKLRVKGVPLREKVEIHISPDPKGLDMADLRFWYRQKLVDRQRVKLSDLNLSPFEF